MATKGNDIFNVEAFGQIPEGEGQANVSFTDMGTKSALGLENEEPLYETFLFKNEDGEIIEPNPFGLDQNMAKNRWPHPQQISWDDETYKEEYNNRDSGPTDLEQLKEAIEASRDLSPVQAFRNVRDVAMRLPSDIQEQLPDAWVEKNPSVAGQWIYLQKHPKTKDLLLKPEFQRLFGDKYKKLGTLEKVWYGNPIASVAMGVKGGWMDGKSKEVFQHSFSGKSLGDPKFAAKRRAYRAEQAEYQDRLENINYQLPRPLALVSEFGVNAGKMAGGMAHGATTPEGAASLLLGGALGLLTGGTGAGAVGMLRGGLIGTSTSMAQSEAGSVMEEIWENQADEFKDESIVRLGGLLTFGATAGLEYLGARGMFSRKAGQALNRGFVRAIGQASPRAAAGAERILASKGGRLLGGLAAHMTPEILTETLQEGFQTAIQIPAAGLYNDLYAHSGLVAEGPSLSDVFSAMGQAAWQTFWGGAAFGGIHPIAEAWQGRGSSVTSEALAKQVADTALKNIHVQVVDRANNSLRQRMKSASNIIREESDLVDNPDIAQHILETFGENKAYANAESLNRMFQSQIQSNPELNINDISEAMLRPLGISLEQFDEALRDNTDLLLDLNGLPEVVNDPLWDGITEILSVEPQGITDELMADLNDMGPPPLILSRPDVDVSQDTRRDLENRLVGAGRKRAFARREASVLARMAGTLAQISGADVNAVLGRIGFVHAEANLAFQGQSADQQKNVTTAATPAILYQDGQGASRGWTDTLAEGFRIAFTEAADASTAIHEFEHVFIQEALRILSLPLEQIADIEVRNALESDMNELAEWAGVKDGVWTEAAHEKAALGFERYFMEGKAPTKSLARIFKQMKRWLMDIYKGLLEMQTPLPENISRVFDRQLATGEEMVVESWRSAPTFDLDDFGQGIDPRAWDDYQEAVMKAPKAAEEQLISFRNAEREKMMHQWQQEGRRLAYEDLRQIRLKDILDGGGISRQSMEAAGYSKALTKELSLKRVGLIRQKSKVGIDEYADRFGFDSAEQFMESLIETPSLAQLTQDYVNQQLAYFEQYFNSDSIISDAELDLYELEANMWSQFMGEPGSKYQARSWRGIKNIIDRNTGVKAVDEIAAQNAADLAASLKAQARAAKAAAKEGFNEGRAEGRVAGYKRGAREAYYTGRNEARLVALDQRLELAAKLKSLAEKKREIEKSVAGWKRIINQKTATPNRPGGILPEYHAAIKNILAMFGLGQQVSSEVNLSEFINGLEMDGISVAVPDWIKHGNIPVWENGARAGRKKTYRSLDYNQFIELNNAVASLLFHGRRQQQIRVNGRLMTEANAAEQLVQSISSHNTFKPSKSQQELLSEASEGKAFGRRIVDALSSYMSGIIKVETMARRLDGGEYNGLAQTMLFEPINKAYDKAALLTDELIEGKLKPIIENTIGLKRLRKLRSEKVMVEVPKLSEQNFVLSREQLLVAALNTGNDQNLAALRNYQLGPGGTKMTDMQYQSLLDTLTQEEWNFVQGIWDFMDNEMFPLLNDLTLKTKGVPLKKVPAMPVMSKFGLFRGGYFPIVFDQNMTERAAHIKETRDITMSSPTLFASQPNTKASATVERSGRAYKDLVPKLSFDVMANSITENIHDLTHREAINDVWRLLKRQDVRQAFSGALGANYWLNTKRWLQEIARPESQGDQGVNRLLRTIRSNTSASAMGLKMSVTLCQVTGLSQSVDKLGTKWMAVGLKEFYAAGKMGEVKSLIDSKSVQMRDRAKGAYDRDVKDALSTHNRLMPSAREKMTDFVFKGIAIMDLAAVYPVWLGSYLKALHEGKAEPAAVSYADAIVRTTQPTGASKDLSYAQRGWGYGEWGKIVTMFSTFFNGTQNLLWERFHQTVKSYKEGDFVKGTVQAGRTAVLLAIVPAFLEHLIKDGWPEDEEDLKDIAKDSVSFIVGGLPVVKDAVSYFLGNSYRFQPAPIFGSIESIAQAPRAFGDILEGDYYKGAQKLMRGVGPLTGLPTSQAGTTLKGVEDWDENEGFEAFWRLLVRGAPK